MSKQETRFADASHMGSKYRQYRRLDDTKLQVLDCDVERLELKIGTLTVDLNAAGFGKVLLDGKPLDGCCALSIRCKVGHSPQVLLKIIAPGIGKEDHSSPTDIEK